jgi:hypothetical protein
MLNRDELKAQHRAELEKLLRRQREVEADKALSAKGFSEELKRIDQAIDAVLEDIDACQMPMFDTEGRPLITLAK